MVTGSLKSLTTLPANVRHHLLGLPFHQQAADQLRRNLLGGAREEGWGEVLRGSWWLMERRVYYT